MDKKKLWSLIAENSVEINEAQIKVRQLQEKQKALLFDLNQLNFKTRYGNQFMAPTVHQLYTRCLSA